MNWVTISRSSPVACKYPLRCVDGLTMRQSHPRVGVPGNLPVTAQQNKCQLAEPVMQISPSPRQPLRGPVRVGKQLAGVNNSLGGPFCSAVLFFSLFFRQAERQTDRQTERPTYIAHHIRQADRRTPPPPPCLPASIFEHLHFFLFFFVRHTQSLLPVEPPLLRRIRSQLQS
jgi:hypothetical protein